MLLLLLSGRVFAETISQEDPAEPKSWEWWKVKRVLSHAQGEMAGEVTQNSVILQSRLTWGDALMDNKPGWPDGDIPGCPGIACFEMSTSEDFADSFTTEWMEAAPEHDFIIKTRVNGLKPGIR